MADCTSITLHLEFFQLLPTFPNKQTEEWKREKNLFKKCIKKLGEMMYCQRLSSNLVFMLILKKDSYL